jgi:16S rRNA (adenine1518-N6/adenine1519-N6)-dimethyltransferase
VQDGHRPRRRFGQNFLHDPATIAAILANLELRVGDRVVEIGPGLGAITIPMLRVLGTLHVVEIDRDLLPRLKARCREIGELVAYQADALSFDFDQISAARNGLRVVGNLPYNISTPLLFRLLGFLQSTKDLHFMLQQELVERLAAQPGTKSYGRLTIMVQCRCVVQPLLKVPADAFRPRPKVDSAFVRLLPRCPGEVPVSDAVVFAEIVRQAFTQRRKKLRNALDGLVSPDAIRAAGVDPDRRPDSLAVGEYAALANTQAAMGG